MAGRLLRSIDPRRSLVAGVMWLIVGLAATFSIAAAVWVGSIARANVLEQHVRRLSLETDQMSSDLGQALTVRLDAIRAAGRILQANGAERRSGLGDVMEELESAYPQLDWMALVDADGTVLRASDGLRAGSEVASSRWFSAALRGPWLGIIAEDAAPLAGAAPAAARAPSSAAAHRRIRPASGDSSLCARPQRHRSHRTRCATG